MVRPIGTIAKWPRALRYAALGSVSGLLALGAFSDFIPAPFLSGRAWIAPMLLLGSGLTVLIVAPAYRIGGWKAVVGKQLFNTVLAICLAPPLLGLLCWLVLAGAGQRWALDLHPHRRRRFRRSACHADRIGAQRAGVQVPVEWRAARASFSGPSVHRPSAVSAPSRATRIGAVARSTLRAGHAHCGHFRCPLNAGDSVPPVAD
ncbi:hypothetical protein [Xanthomonas arboricola]|uniref:hypothetical protein n=1 Tax=Xanthomonas arboricola TaxID=56448 RepID=UPI003D18E669